MDCFGRKCEGNRCFECFISLIDRIKIVFDFYFVYDFCVVDLDRKSVV